MPLARTFLMCTGAPAASDEIVRDAKPDDPAVAPDARGWGDPMSAVIPYSR